MANIHKPLTIVAIVAHLAVLVGVGYTVARAAMFFAFGPQSSPVAAIVMSRPAAGPQAVHIEQIAGWHLFGQPPADFNKAAELSEKLPETRLSLTLVGVFVSDDIHSSIALIARKGRPAESYRVGDRVPGNAKLAAVFANHVVISRGGVREQIRFRERKAALVQVERSHPEAHPEDPEDPEESLDTSKASAAPAMQPDDPPPAHKALTVLQHELKKDPKRFLADLGVARVSEDEALGYAIGAVADHPSFSHVGLQPGDRLLSVNGRSVGDPEQDRLRIEDILAEGSARLEIERSGQRLAVTVSLN